MTPNAGDISGDRRQAEALEAAGRAAVEGGRFIEAAQAFERAGALDPQRIEVWLAAGKAWMRANRRIEADAAFARYFALAPARAVLAEAAERHAQGDVAGALDTYRGLLARAPDDVDALRLIGVACTQLARFDEAEAALREALRLAPDFALAWSNLGALLLEMSKPADAVAALSQALARDPDDAQARFNLANAKAALGAYEAACAIYEAVLTERPNHQGALIGLGHVLKTIGRRDEAIAAYRACLDVREDYGEVWWSLANLKTYRFEAADIDRMRTLSADASLSETSRIGIGFALAKALEDRGDYDAAWSSYLDANRRQRARSAYDPVQTEAINDRIIATFTAERLAKRAGLGHPDAAPIFVVGLPRSGSTLIEQILASHPEVEGTSELPDLGQLAVSVGKFRSDGVGYPEAALDLEPADFRALGRAYIERTRSHRALGRAYFTDKMPNNFPSVGFAALILPNAKIIDARRHPLDSVLGSFKQLFAKGQTFSYDLFELAEYYLQYDRMIRWWDEVLPGKILRLNYEDMVLDQEIQTRRLIEHCGLAWNDACLTFHQTDRAVKTASSEQVRRPLYADALQTWRRFEPHLDDLRAHLAPVLDALPDRVRNAGI